MGITRHGGKRPGRKRKCGGSAAPPWKPHLCLPERSAGHDWADPVRSTSMSKKGVTQICATTLKPPSNPSIVTEDGLVRSYPMHLDSDPSHSQCSGSAFHRAPRSVVWVGWARLLSAPGLRAWGTAGASTSVRHGQTFSNERAADVPTVNEQRAAEPPEIALIRALCPGSTGTGHTLKFN